MLHPLKMVMPWIYKVTCSFLTHQHPNIQSGSKERLTLLTIMGAFSLQLFFLEDLDLDLCSVPLGSPCFPFIMAVYAWTLLGTDRSPQSSWDHAELYHVDTMSTFILPMGKLRLRRFWNFSTVPELLHIKCRIETLADRTPEPVFFTTKFSGSLTNIEK